MSCDAGCRTLEDEQEAIYFFIAVKLIHISYKVTYLL